MLPQRQIHFPLSLLVSLKCSLQLLAKKSVNAFVHHRECLTDVPIGFLATTFRFFWVVVVVVEGVVKTSEDVHSPNIGLCSQSIRSLLMFLLILRELFGTISREINMWNDPS